MEEKKEKSFDGEDIVWIFEGINGSATVSTEREFSRFLSKEFVGTPLEGSKFCAYTYDLAPDEMEPSTLVNIMTEYNGIFLFPSLQVEHRAVSIESRKQAFEDLEYLKKESDKILAREDWIEESHLRFDIDNYINAMNNDASLIEDNERDYIYSLLVNTSRGTKEAFLNLYKMDYKKILEEYNANKIPKENENILSDEESERLKPLFASSNKEWETEELEAMILKNNKITDCEIIKGSDGDYTEAFIKFQIGDYYLYDKQFASSREVLFEFANTELNNIIEDFAKYTSSNLVSRIFLGKQLRLRNWFEEAKANKSLSENDDTHEFIENAIEEVYSTVAMPIDMFHSFKA